MNGYEALILILLILFYAGICLREYCIIRALET